MCLSVLNNKKAKKAHLKERFPSEHFIQCWLTIISMNLENWKTTIKNQL